MENLVMDRRRDESGVIDTRKFPIMRTLARFHECDAETLCSRVEASEPDVHDILREMVARKEVEASPRRSPGDGRVERFSLTLKGWSEYMQALGSIYELSE
jgi:DNA-binding MarR family transcriptional regulator